MARSSARHQAIGCLWLLVALAADLGDGARGGVALGRDGHSQGDLVLLGSRTALAQQAHELLVAFKDRQRGGTPGQLIGQRDGLLFEPRRESGEALLDGRRVAHGLAVAQAIIGARHGRRRGDQLLEPLTTARHGGHHGQAETFREHGRVDEQALTMRLVD